MPSDPTKRIASWDIKYDLERIGAILTAKRPKMFERIQEAFISLSGMELQVKQVLDAEGVSIITYPFYLDFGRELWRLRRMSVSGESMAIEAATLIGKWVSRGLSQSVLEAIRTQTFDIVAPTP